MKWLVLISIALTMSCSSTQHTNNGKASAIPEVIPIYAPGPHVMVYRTKDNYRLKVPVQLNEERNSIVSYPHPSDLMSDGQLRLPTQLANGYLLDNKGIHANVAFLNMTYTAYAKLTQPPSVAILNNSILEREPLLELYDCGLRSAFLDVETQLNALIESNKLESACKKIK